MQSTAATPDDYLNTLPDDRKEVMSKLRQVINDNLPEGFEEKMAYGMMGWVIPKSTYPAGYHCDPKLALPFLNIASQKNFVALYHMGMYSDPKLLEWFTSEFPKHAKFKLDIGKSCVRFKRMDDIPYALIAELVSKMTPRDWIDRYETALLRK